MLSNVATDNLAVKPCIPQKIYFYEFVVNVLHDNIGRKKPSLQPQIITISGLKVVYGVECLL